MSSPPFSDGAGAVAGVHTSGEAEHRHRRADVGHLDPLHPVHHPLATGRRASGSSAGAVTGYPGIGEAETGRLRKSLGQVEDPAKTAGPPEPAHRAGGHRLGTLLDTTADA